MTRILSVGECMVELSPAGDGHLRQGFAGDTFNTAWYLRRLLPEADSVAYFSTVGDDAMSKAMLAFAEQAGIDISTMAVLPKRTSGLYLITLDGHERSFTYWRDTSAARALADDPERLSAAIAAADVVYASGITLAILAPDRRSVLVDALRAARDAGKTVAFDPNIRERLWPDAETLRAGIEAGAGAASICLPSFDDETRHFGDVDPAATAARYRALGCAEVIVKDGAGDALVVSEAGSQTVPGIPVAKPVDTTGAGDSFGAAYLAARSRGEAPTEAAAAAHRVAAKVIQGYGALVEIDAGT